ncbi:MAG: hypothetical protein AAGI23_07305 [Bacteroidota bacterium]
MTALLLLLFVIVGVTLAIIGLKILRNLFTNFRPSEHKVQADIRKMREEIAPFTDQLVPLDSQELELFSLNQLNQSLKKGITTTAKGVYTSIYQEPLVAYAYKRYLGGHALLYARTATREIVYKIGPKNTQVAINQEFYGSIKGNTLYSDSKGRKALAQMNRNTQELALPVLVGDREIAMINATVDAATPQPRAFRYVQKNISESEEQAFLTLAILNMVERVVE